MRPVKVLDAGGGLVYLLDENKQSLAPVAHRGLSGAVILELSRCEMGRGLSGYVAQTEEALVAGQRRDPRNLSPVAVREGWNSYAGVPIKSKGQVLGVLALMARQEGHFKTDQLDLLGHIGNQLGVAIENAQLHAAALREITRHKQTRQELEESEERFRRAVNSAPYPIIIHTEDGEIISVNQVWTELSGYQHYEIPTISDWVARVYGSSKERDRIKAGIDDLYDLTNLLDEGEFRIICKDGSQRLWNFISVPLGRLADGRRTVVSMANDVTEQRKAEQEREHLQTQLAQAQKMEAVGRLTAGVAHDFNNLLTVITGYAERMEEELEASDPNHKAAEKISAAAWRAVDLVSQLMIFSRKGMIEVRLLDPVAATAEVNKMLERIIGEDIEIEYRMAAEVGHVWADPTRLQQLFVNLAANSRDAMPQGGKLTIALENVILDEAFCATRVDVEPGAYVLLTFSDTGTGMSQEVQDHLFEPFFTTKEVGAGNRTGPGYGIRHCQADRWAYRGGEPGGRGHHFPDLFAAGGRRDGTGRTRVRSPASAARGGNHPVGGGQPAGAGNGAGCIRVSGVPAVRGPKRTARSRSVCQL